ncbi:hypothetical protein NL108_017894 [Boleophthalmus pectinirostris]|nr:hypothetical protein NL108_017894 [Boleophthalmus pectinirostris]
MKKTHLYLCLCRLLLLLPLWFCQIQGTEAGLKQVCFSGSDSHCLRIYIAENDQLLYDGASSSSPPPSCTSAPVGSETPAPVNETCQVCGAEGKVLAKCWLINPETRLDFEGNRVLLNFTKTSCPGPALSSSSSPPRRFQNSGAGLRLSVGLVLGLLLLTVVGVW